MFILDIAVFARVTKCYSYLSSHEVNRGCRVIVPLRRSSVIGVVVSSRPFARSVNRAFDLKNIIKIIDDEPKYSAVLLEMAEWMSRYYFYPIGEVLRTVFPPSLGLSVKKNYSFVDIAGLDAECSLIFVLIFGTNRKKIVSENFLLKKLKKSIADYSDNECSQLIKKCVDDGILREHIQLNKKSAKKNEFEHKLIVECQNNAKRSVGDFPRLTDEQKDVLDSILEGMKDPILSKKPILLWGITGSGKTEVYMRLMNHLLVFEESLDGQALVMVPEISLTPQMTRVFENRFPGLVGVVHSAMSGSERNEVLEQIRTGETRILIGPRSTVFAPFSNLKIIIVDEEHDSSYKQNSGLFYNARDIAVLRGFMEKAYVVLGSATPSLESYYNSLRGKYRLLCMKKRVGDSKLPKISIIEPPLMRKSALLTKESSQMDEFEQFMPIHPHVIERLNSNFEAGHQAMVILNRRGFASYLFSIRQQQAVRCSLCSVSMTVHTNGEVLKCHYCNKIIPFQLFLRDNPDDQFLVIGYGSQRAERYLAQTLSQIVFDRVDSDSVAKKGYLNRKLELFAKKQIDVLVGTQILAKGHDFSNVTLIVLLEVDQQLNLPDFRAGERTFQLLVQSAGRAGRRDIAGSVLIQSNLGEHYVIQSALAQDYEGFAKRELDIRQKFGYPPFVKMISIEIDSRELQKLEEFSQKVEQWMTVFISKGGLFFSVLRVQGPSTPAVDMIRGRHRKLILLFSGNMKILREFVEQFIKNFKAVGDIRIKIDVDPQVTF